MTWSRVRSISLSWITAVTPGPPGRGSLTPREFPAARRQTMIGSGAARPPFPVTLDNWQSAGQLNWTFQHMAEIFPTIPISRGSWPAPSLPRIAYDPDGLSVRTHNGETSTVHTVMAGTDTDGWLVLRDHPSWGAQV